MTDATASIAQQLPFDARRCHRCGEPFVPRQRTGGSRQRFCSTGCRLSFHSMQRAACASVRPACSEPSALPAVLPQAERENAPQATGASKDFKQRCGRSSRKKSDRAERALVRLLQDHSFAAERGTSGADLNIPLLGIDRSVAVKVRAHGFRELYRCLVGRQLLIVRADREASLVVLPLKLAVEIAEAAELARMRGYAP